MSMRTTAWLQMFEQTIDQYSDDSYTVLDSREEDEDQTLGLRMVLERPSNRWTGGWSATRS
jgi:hypothetical protein